MKKKKNGRNLKNLEDTSTDNLETIVDSESESRERFSPYNHPEWNQLRAEIFIQALEVHRVFILQTADKNPSGFPRNV